MAFKIAGSMGFKSAVAKADPALLEPLHQFIELMGENAELANATLVRADPVGWNADKMRLAAQVDTGRVRI
jgi:hypothetical protein